MFHQPFLAELLAAKTHLTLAVPTPLRRKSRESKLLKKTVLNKWGYYSNTVLLTRRDCLFVPFLAQISLGAVCCAAARGGQTDLFPSSLVNAVGFKH